MYLVTYTDGDTSTKWECLNIQEVANLIAVKVGQEGYNEASFTTKYVRKIEWTKIKHDINGNPRYVCHFMALNTQTELDEKSNDIHHISNLYAMAVKRANKIGGKKYHTKAYGGGIVFQSYSIDSTERDIAEVLAKDQS